MKIQIWFALAMFIFSSSVVNSQIVNSFGIKIGGAKANQTWKRSDNLASNLESRLGLDIAVFLEIIDIEFVGLLVEAHYIQKGFSQRFLITTEEHPDGTGEFFTLKPRVDYLSFPVLAKFNLPIFLSPYIIAGPRFDIRLGRKSEGFQAVFDELKKVDVGGTLGFGIESPKLNTVNLLAEFRFSPSFTRAFENQLLNVKNKSIEFLTGLSF